MLLLSLLALPVTLADAVTLYTGSDVTATTSSLAAGETYTGAAAYDPTRLTAPSPPSAAVTSITMSIPSNGAGVAAEGLSLSIPQKGNFLGFSIEMSVATSLLGARSGTLKVPFLNFMANIQNRAGAGPIVRVGGNSQEGSTIFVDGLEDGAAMDKIKVSSGVTDTPLLNYSPELFYIMSNISSLVGVEWYFGLAFNETDVDAQITNIPLAATWAQDILGDSLLGLSVGNEPDLYVDHSHREAGYTVADYVSEYDETLKSIIANGSLLDPSMFVGPSLCCQVAGFEFSDLETAGWLDNNADRLSAVSVQHYPTNNCQVNGAVIEPQDIFSDFLNHTSAQALVGAYLSDSATVQERGIEMVMLEMNTASCGGFAGLSDSFGAAMWMADYALQMAYGNFSAALMHVGGQNVYYNPFTPPPSNMSSVEQWTPGSVYYPTLLIAEAFGKSNSSRIVDLTPLAEVDANYIYHPVYGIYENDALARMVLFNFIDDSTGGSDLEVVVNVQNQASPGEVYVRYLQADSVSEQYDIYWANQTLGSSFAADGRLSGDQTTYQITCDTTSNTCTIPVYAPSIALVFFSTDFLDESSVEDTATSTYGTSVVGSGDATVDVGSLQTSNGGTGSGSGGGTSKASEASGAGRVAGGMGWVGLVGMVVVGLLL
ncbi:hypothetical protein IAR50_006662 [Cryptococcus sp. DSM 104548]